MFPPEFISIGGNTQKLVSIIMCICFFCRYIGSYGIWGALEVRAFGATEKVHVAAREGMASLCE